MLLFKQFLISPQKNSKPSNLFTINFQHIFNLFSISSSRKCKYNDIRRYYFTNFPNFLPSSLLLVSLIMKPSKINIFKIANIKNLSIYKLNLIILYLKSSQNNRSFLFQIVVLFIKYLQLNSYLYNHFNFIIVAILFLHPS